MNLTAILWYSVIHFTLLLSPDITSYLSLYNMIFNTLIFSNIY